MGCSHKVERNTREYQDQEQLIKSKLRLKHKNIDFDQSQLSSLYQDVSDQWFDSPVSAQKLFLADVNSDNKIDIVTLKEKYSSPQVYLKNSRIEKFQHSDKYIFPRGHRSSFYYIDDFNRDGVLDFYSGQFYLNVQYSVPPSHLLIGKREGDVTNYGLSDNIFSSPKPNSSILPVDIDLDGKLEFIQMFWLNNSSGSNKFFPLSVFSLGASQIDLPQVTNESFQGSPAWGGEICDINNDDLVDILIANTSSHENLILSNNNSFGFKEDSNKFKTLVKDSNGDGLLLGNGNSFGYICADFDNDGLFDILSYEEKRVLQDAVRDPLRIHFQKKPSDLDYPFKSGLFPIGLKNYSIKRVIEFDMDNDGDVDLLLENNGYPPNSRLLIFENINGKFINISNNSGISIINPSGVNVLDIDNDGVLEIIVVQSKVRAPYLPGFIKIFKMKLEENQNNSIKLFLQGKQSNPSGVGAIVEIKGKKTYQKHLVNYLRGGALGQRSRFLHFGVGQDKSIEIEVSWPSNVVKKKKYSYKFKGDKRSAFLSVCEDGRILEGKKTVISSFIFYEIDGVFSGFSLQNFPAKSFC